jgi:hypothetical protein
MTYEQYTPDLAKHERRPQRYSTTNESCTGYSVGLTSQNVLQIHFTAYQSELSAQRDDCPALTVAAKSYQTEQEGRPICTAAHPTVSHLPDSAGEEGLDDAPGLFQLSRPISEPQCLPESTDNLRPSKNFHCQHCSKTFNRLYNLKSHLVTHDRTMSFSCDICNRAFARKSDAKRHMRTHSGEKDWVCQGCETAFARRDMLSSHHKSHKGQACLRSRQSQQAQRDGLEKSQSPKILSISSLLS